MSTSATVLNEVANGLGPDNTTAGSIPTESEAAVCAYVKDLFFRARDARRPLVQQWKKNYKALNLRNYTTGGESWMPNPQVSEIWPVIASSVAWMTDQRPTLEVTPSSEAFSPYHEFYQQLATDLNVCMNSSFVEYQLDAEISKALWDANTYGIGYFKTTWEPWLAEGLGDSAFRRVDAFTVYPDPFARSERELTYIIEAKVMMPDDVDRAFPGAKKKMGYIGGWLEDADESPHKLDGNVQAGQTRAAVAPLTSHNAASNRAPTSTGTRQGQAYQASPVTVLECWVRSHETTPALDDDAPDTHRVKDVWRCIVTCGSHVLLDELASDVNAYATHPYSRLVLFDTGEWYGPCIVEFLISAQESINRTLQSIENNIALMGNPVVVESPYAKSRNKRMTNQPGQRIEANTNEVAWLNAPAMQPQIAMQLVTFYESRIESISGLSAMVRGFSPTGRNSSGVLDSVQDAAFVRVRASLRELERALRTCSSHQAANIAEFYTEPRMVSLLGQDGQKTYTALKARHFYSIDPDEETGARVPLRFSLLADAGSQLPTSKQARSADAERLFALGGIDVYEMLKAKQWPNYAIVAKRMMEQQAAGAVQGPTQRDAARA